MTKVTLHYQLGRVLSDGDFAGIDNIHGTYGIVRVQVPASLDQVTVDYDASRLMKKDVEAVLARHGLPVKV